MKRSLLALLFSSALFAQLPQVAVPTQQLTGAGQAVVATLEGTGYTTMGIQVTGTFSGTITFESSVDCTTWSSLSVWIYTVGTLSEQSTATSTGQWLANIPGLCAARARMSSYTSGTAVVTLRPAIGAVPIPVGVNIAGADGVSNALGVETKLPGSAGYAISWPYLFNGATWDRSFYCNQTAAVSVTAAATTQIVALSGTTKIRVCSFSVTMSAAGTAQFVQGTGSNCGTGTANLTAATNLATATPWTVSAGQGAVFTGTAANALCVAAVTGNVTGFITYAQY